jgi:hypothetical protein
MPFKNPILAGDVLIRTGMQSENYDPGVDGWRIERNGNVEFNDGTFRGNITGATITASSIVSDSALTDARITIADGAFTVRQKSDDLLLGEIYFDDVLDKMIIRASIDNGMIIESDDGPLLITTVDSNVTVASDGITSDLLLQGGQDVIIDALVDVNIDSAAGVINISHNGTPRLGIVFDTANPEIQTAGILNLIADTNITFGRGGIISPHARLERINADAFLLMNRNANTNNALRVNGASGNPYVGSTTDTGGTFRPMRASSFDISSDRKWKTNIRDVDESTRERMRTCQAKRFIDNEGLEQIGFVANEMPQDVRRDIPPGDETEGAAYSLSAVLALAWDEIQELRGRLEEAGL